VTPASFEFSFDVVAMIIGIVVGLMWAPWSSILIDRPPLIGATDSLGLPFRCQECRSPISFVAGLPFIGRLLVRGRCQSCNKAVPGRELANDILCVVIGGLTGGFIGRTPALPALLFAALLLVPVSIVDLRIRKIATRLVYPGALVTAVLLTVAAAVDGEWRRLIVALLCGVGAWAFIWVLFIIYPDGMGDGDARLCLMLGMITGWFGWPTAMVGILAGFVTGSMVGIGYGVVTRKYLKATLPFGPWLGLGALAIAWIAKYPAVL
jgi:leader peptidase (prepilin peptidase) / N-methyltransferase